MKNKGIKIDHIISKSHCRIEAMACFDCSQSALWDRAGHPHKLAPACINLRDFSAGRDLAKGNLVFEIHTFAGIPQTYRGKVTDFRDGVHWEMSTTPRTLTWLFGLPHRVRYQFGTNSIGSNLTVSCDYQLQGVFTLPIIRSLVTKTMERAVRILVGSADR